jgi:2-keto-myo-inositol isomerase
MIPCINQATVLPLDTLEFIIEAREAGFRLVELDIMKLEEAIQRHGLSTVKDTVSSAEVRVVSLNAIENYPILTPNDMEETLDRCERIFKLSKELGCEIVVVNPNEYAPATRMQTELAFDSFIKKAVRLSSQFSVRLGYEFVAYGNRIVNTLADSLRGLSRWNSESQLGLVLDIFHLFRTGEEITQIPVRMINRVWIFHVNDAPPLPMSVLKDSDRVFPGEGVINVQKAVEELERAGFSGPVSLELFNQDYWGRPAAQVLHESWDRLQRLLESTVR